MWTVKDEYTGRKVTYENEPTRDDLRELKQRLGYAHIRVMNHDYKHKFIAIHPVDVMDVV